MISKLVHHKEIGNRLSTFTCDSKTTAAIQSNELSRILEIAHELANYDHLIVVDTTCADTSKMLRNSVESFDCSVVSANKKPFADSDLKTFKALTLHRSTRFESTVGAGLPVICTWYSSAKRENFNYLSRFITHFVVRSTRTTTHSQCNNSNTHTNKTRASRSNTGTIDRLLRGGDEIVRVAGSLSGTLGYIMSNIQDGKTLFSDCVKDAKAKGFTEPDPRDDLSGTDVARKALIMARRIGLNVSMSDVEIEPLFPNSMKSLTLNEFMKKLPELNADMSARVQDARDRNACLRYVATLDTRPAKPVLRVGLEVVPVESALGSLKGTENMVCIATKFYNITRLS